MKRIQEANILKDLDKKMVIIVGPRQAGKTWLAKRIAANHFKNSVYLNYDFDDDRQLIEERTWLPTTDLLILDELHKMKGWKNYLKGLVDVKPKTMKLLVTGSARMDVFRQVGDSLAGRYFMHRLLPLSPAELHQLGKEVDLDYLLERSGFPEPYLAKDPVDADRWRLQYINSLITTDVLDFDHVQDLKAIRSVFNLLRKKVGSPVSYKGIADDVGISPTTVKKYVRVLEALYIVFTVTPFSKNIARSLLKEPKIYFYDNALVEGDKGVRFENLVATCLLKDVCALEDYQAKEYRLHYLRTKDKQEVDFAITLKDKIEKMIEVKYSSKDLSKSLYYFYERYQLPAIQIVKDLRQEFRHSTGIDVLRAGGFLKELYL